MEAIAEQFAAINVGDLCADEIESARAQQLETLPCQSLQGIEAYLSKKQLTLREKGEKLDSYDTITLNALCIVLLDKHVKKELSTSTVRSLPLTQPLEQKLAS